MKSALECQRYAVECEQAAAQAATDAATRERLLATAGEWRKLAKDSEAREAGTIPEQYRSRGL